MLQPGAPRGTTPLLVGTTFARQTPAPSSPPCADAGDSVPGDPGEGWPSRGITQLRFPGPGAGGGGGREGDGGGSAPAPGRSARPRAARAAGDSPASPAGGPEGPPMVS